MALSSRGKILLNCSVPAVSMISSITCLPCLFECVSQSRLFQLWERSGFSYIHVDRFAICVFDGWIIALNEDSLDELRCIQSLVSMRATTIATIPASEKDKINIPVKALFPTPPDPRTAMLYSLLARKNYKRKPLLNREWGHERQKKRKIAYLCCPARDDMTHQSKSKKSKALSVGVSFRGAQRIYCVGRERLS